MALPSVNPVEGFQTSAGHLQVLLALQVDSLS